MANQIGRRVRGLVNWAGPRPQQVSDRVHADGDALAISHGWVISSGTGWLGFGNRQYRDPRFDLLPGARSDLMPATVQACAKSRGSVMRDGPGDE